MWKCNILKVMQQMVEWCEWNGSRGTQFLLLGIISILRCTNPLTITSHQKCCSLQGISITMITGIYYFDSHFCTCEMKKDKLSSLSLSPSQNWKSISKDLDLGWRYNYSYTTHHQKLFKADKMEVSSPNQKP